MTEIKAPLTDRIKLFLSNHLLLVGLVLFCVVLFFSSCGRANAAEPISPYEIQYLKDLMQTWDTEPDNTPVDFTSLYSQFESDCNNYPYYVTNNSNYIIMCKKPSFGLVSVYDSSYNPLEVAFNVSDYPNWQDSFPFIVYQAYSPSSDWQVVIRFVVSDFNGGMTVSPMRFSWTGNMVYSKTDYTRITYYNSTQFSVSNTSWYGNVDSFYRCNGSQGTGYLNTWTVSQLSVTPIQIPYTEDSRLKFSTYTLPSGGEYLQTDIRKIVKDFPVQDGSHSTMGLDPESITLTVEYDGDYDGTTRTFTLDSTNSVISDKYIFSTEFDVFGDFSEYNNVFITSCEFTLSGSAQGLPEPVSETYRISCEYYLKKFVPNPLVPDDTIVRDDSVYEDSKTDAEITQIVSELSEKTTLFQFGEWRFARSLDGVPSWADIYEMYSFDYVDMSSSNFAGRFYNHPYVLGSSEVDIIPFIEDKVMRFYDVVVFKIYKNTSDWVDPLQPPSFDFYGYIILYTDRYFERMNSLSQLDILTVLQNDANQQQANWTWLCDKLDDFEAKTLTGMTNHIDVTRRTNNILSSVDLDLRNGFVDVVEAINNIDIPVPTPFDDDDILTVLGTIISKLDNIISNQNNPKDGFIPLIAWIKDDTNTNGLYTWVNAITTGSDNMMKKVFDVFSLDDLDPDTSGVQTYINYSKSFFEDVSGTGQGNYFQRLFNFNININDWNGGV